MELSPSLKAFIREHADDDLNRLLLSASRYPGVDVTFVVDQIAARRQVKDKLPVWFACEDIVFPSRIAAEQSSSEVTGEYKQRLVETGVRLCDLTGGLGVDSYFFSQKAKEVVYIERFPEYCEAARNNFEALNVPNIRVRQGDATVLIEELTDIDVFYIDPARRGESNKRLFALTDCEPDLTMLLPRLFERAPKVIAKISPMLDISQTLELLPATTEIHVLSVKNECKELLFVLERGKEETEPVLHCVNYTTGGREEGFRFTMTEEREALSSYCQSVGTYLYEPNASILKAGAFKMTAKVYDVEKLAVNSHLYTSDRLVTGFPGRTFTVDEVIPFHSRLAKTLHKDIPIANITTRNFPLSVEELRKRTKIKEGGDVYLFATTLTDNTKVLIRSTKVI